MARASVSGVQSSWMPSTWMPRRASQQAAGRRPVMTNPQAVARRRAWRLLTGHRPQSALVSVCRKTQRKAARASGTARGKAGRKTVKSNSRICPRQGLNSPQARAVPSGAVACRSRRPGALTRRSQSSSRGWAQAYMAQPVSPFRHMRAKRALRPASSRTASRRKASRTSVWPRDCVFVCSMRAPVVSGIAGVGEREGPSQTGRCSGTKAQRQHRGPPAPVRLRHDRVGTIPASGSSGHVEGAGTGQPSSQRPSPSTS